MNGLIDLTEDDDDGAPVNSNASISIPNEMFIDLTANVYTYIYICMYVCIYQWLYVCIYVCM
jgi:hypothetical protein